MNHLSNADIRTLYLRRRFLEAFVTICSADSVAIGRTDNWRANLDRLRTVREEIKGIVDDPQFDVLVRIPNIAQPGPTTFSESGTMMNIIAGATELISYVDGRLSLYSAPKGRDLVRGNPAKVFIRLWT